MLTRLFKGKISILVEPIAAFFFSITIMLLFVAFFSKPTAHEADIGDFSVYDFNNGWTMTSGNTAKEVTLPLTVEDAKDSMIILSNTLPDYIEDGMTLSTRESIADIDIYIDGEIRSYYNSESLPFKSYTVPSAYVCVQLTHEDAGKQISICQVPMGQGYVNTVAIGYGNNYWFTVLKENLAVVVIAIVLVFFALVALAIHVLVIRSRTNNKSVKYIGQLVLIYSIWIISESRLRQLFFKSPSYTEIFAYFAVELLAFYAAAFFDEIQGRKHHNAYMIVKFAIIMQAIINALLALFQIKPLYETLVFSHVWMGLAMVVSLSCIIIDIVNHAIKDYIITACGMLGLTLLGCLELVAFYLLPSHALGSFLCIGLLVMLFCTMLQVIKDETQAVEERMQHQKQMTITTIETIANTIDAKDEYTGGHSDRVGQYAGRLAKAVASRYDLSDEDVDRIEYIGKMHDIGKIGIPDAILNKKGKLDDAEYLKMKEHVTVGARLLQGIENIPGLTEGVKHHHERFDGKGYPDGLAGENIPLVARILCIADCYDAMTTNRVYRKRLTDEEVMSELLNCSGSQFDPQLIPAFVELVKSGELA